MNVIDHAGDPEPALRLLEPGVCSREELAAAVDSECESAMLVAGNADAVAGESDTAVIEAESAHRN